MVRGRRGSCRGVSLRRGIRWSLGALGLGGGGGEGVILWLGLESGVVLLGSRGILGVCAATRNE